MPLTSYEQMRLDEVQVEIAQIEARLAVVHGLGDTHSSQGVSASFTDTMRWRQQLSNLRSLRNKLVAKQNGERLPPRPGANLSYYSPL
jgi:hypothetical protein